MGHITFDGVNVVADFLFARWEGFVAAVVAEGFFNFGFVLLSIFGKSIANFLHDFHADWSVFDKISKLIELGQEERQHEQNGKININDGLKLNSTYITNILKCVPPKDRPLNNELINCSDFFIQELKKKQF